MPEYALNTPKIPYPWELIPGALKSIGNLFPSMPSPAPQSKEPWNFPTQSERLEDWMFGFTPPEKPTPIKVPPLPPSGPGPGAMVTAPQKTALQLAKEDAQKEFEAWQKAISAPGAIISPGVGQPGLSPSFTLSPNFFATHPGIEGGTYTTPGGTPKFLFNEVKTPTIMDIAMPVIQRWADQLAKMQAGGMSREDIVGTMPDAAQLAAFANLIGAQTTAGKAPAEIAHLWAQATRGQITPGVPSGPAGQQSTLLFPPFGGAPRTVATGTPLEHGQGITGLINQGYIEFMKKSAEIDVDPLIPADQKAAVHAALQDRFRNYATGIQQMLGVGRTAGGPAAPGAATKPSWEQFYTTVKKAGSKMTDAALMQYYRQNYGG